MHVHFPIYNLFHQEIKACAEHLLEISGHNTQGLEEHSCHVFSRLSELHQFANKVLPEEHYYPLRELKFYLENTMLSYEDVFKQLQTIRLSEAIFLLKSSESNFEPKILRSLTDRFLCHFCEESKPGKNLFKKLTALKKL